MHKSTFRIPTLPTTASSSCNKKDDERRPTRERGYLKACCNETRCCCDGILTGVVVLNDRA